MKKYLSFFIFLFLFIPNVYAENYFQFANQRVGTSFSVPGNGGYVTGQGYFVVPYEQKSNFVVMSFCSTAPLTLYVKGIGYTQVSGEIITLKSNNSCTVNGYNGYIYQSYLNVLQWDDAGGGKSGITLDSSIFNYTSYNSATLFLQYGVTDTVDLDFSSAPVVNNQINIDLSTTNQELSDLNRNVIWSYQVNEQQNQKIDETNEKLDDLNDNITSDDISSSDDTLNNIKNNLPTNSVVSDLLLLPVTLYQKIINSLNGSCSSFNLGTLYNHDLTLPCINLENYLGSSIFNAIDLIISGLFILVIRKKFVDIFNNMTNLKNGGNEVE